MKIKILIIMISSLLLTGCYDYQEITDLGIIVALGIDYKNDEYIITYEVLEDNKDKQSGVTSSYTVTASDNNLANAFEKTANMISKKAYYSHIDIVLFSKNIVTNHFREITDYLLRNKDLREDFGAVIVDNPQEILSSTNSKLKVIGSNITQSLKTNNLETKYSDIITDILTFGKDSIIPIIDIDNDSILITGLAIFHNYNMVNYLNSDNLGIYNVLTNTNRTILNNEKYSISIYNSNINIKMNKYNIIIIGNVNAELLDNNYNHNIKDPQVLKKIEKDFNILLNHEINNFINTLQSNKTDILGITKNYYQKTRIKNNKLWLHNNIDSNVEVHISKKGIIYEVHHD